MKRIGMSLMMIIGAAFASDAQITLPYNNGFDTNSENADWVLYRKGLTMINGSESHAWEPYPSTGAATPPNYLAHDYPVGYSGTQMTDDWLVSKSINFTNGAKLSCKAWIYAIMAPTPGDTVDIYLLKGNPDPALATKVKIASLRGMTVNTGSFNTPVWKDTANIVIPATTGNAYLAFRYTSIDNWFTAAIDNLKLVANPTGIDDVSFVKTQFRLYPNPASSVISWNIAAGDLQKLNKQEGAIINYQGRELKRFSVKDATVNIDFLSPGIYFIKIGETMESFTKL